jgi:hypothetical protein
VDKNKKVNGTVVTFIGYRLGNGLVEQWWNGSAWATASAGQWNTEAEVAANIATFVGQSIQVIANLRTTDATQTPELYLVKLLYETDIEFEQEYIARSLLPAMREEVRPISLFPIDVPAATTIIDLSVIETPYNILDIDSVYNLTADPDKLANLSATYDGSTKRVTLGAPVGPCRVLVRFVYLPEMMIIRSQDYTELSKIPAVCIESIVQDSHTPIESGPSVCDRFGDGAGWQLKEGFQANINFTVRFTTDKVSDLDSLSDELKRFFENRLLRARGQDEFVRLQTFEEYSHQPSALQSELHSARLRARIFNAVFYVRDAVPVTATQRFIVAGGNVAFQV